MDFEDVRFSAVDGVRLHGWFIPGGDEITLLWLHGNGGNIAHRLDVLSAHHRLGASIFIIDYRGYGISEGRPSEKGTYRDAEAALGYLTSRNDRGGRHVVLYGHSLGCAVALEVAARHEVGAVVLESPFTSVHAMARSRHPIIPSWLPLWPIIEARYDSLSRIERVAAPIMIVHGELDETVPFEMGRELFAAANEPKRLLAVPGAGHSDVLEVSGGLYLDALRTFLDDHVGRRPS